jgi:hypothetical protein
MRKKYCDQESVFEFIWKHADRDGLWDGDANTLAEEFHVLEDETHDALGELCDRGLMEELYAGKYAIVKWRERDHADEEGEQ